MACSCLISTLLLVVLVAFDCTGGEPVADPNAQKPKSFHGVTPDLSVLIKPLPNGLLKAVQHGVPAVMPVGSSFDLDCHILPGGDPDAAVAWLKDGRPFMDSARAKVIGWLGGNQYEDYQIRFFNFTQLESGRYTCATPQGNISATLGVPPFVSRKVADLQVFSGDRFEITCPVTAFPPVSYSWISPLGTTLDNEHAKTMTVPAALPTMNGTFSCEGRNSIGQASTQINVLVKQRLAWTQTSPAVVRSREYSTVKLQCHASGYPRSAVLWTVKKTGRALERITSNETDGALTLYMVTSANEGNYTCAVRSTLPCCDDEQAQPPLLKTMRLQVLRVTDVTDPVTPCPDGDTTCSEDSGSSSLSSHILMSIITSSLIILSMF